MEYNQRLTAFNGGNIIMSAGPHKVSGFEKGTSVELVFNEDQYKSVRGGDGETIVTSSNDRSAKMTVNLLQSSLSNDYFSAAYNRGLALPSGIFVFPCEIYDPASGTLAVCAKSWVVKQADLAFGEEQKPAIWVLETNHAHVTRKGLPAV